MKTKLPPLENGSSRRGAQMGRSNSFPDKFDPQAATPKLRLYRLRWVDGDYDEAGAYWGNSGGTSIFRAVVALPCPAQHYFGHVEIFVRSADRQAAKEAVREIIPGARFHT